MRIHGKFLWAGILIALLGSVAGLTVLSCARAQPAGTADSPSISDDDFSASRERLIERLIRLGYLRTEPVTKALRETPRHLFVPGELQKYAYEDHPLPIGHEQTISAPSIVAVMTELIEPKRTKVILEVGTGSGYQAAVLSPLCKQVYTIEILEPLGTSAKAKLTELGYKNVTVKIGDGYKGWQEHAPFDGIMVTCAPEKVPQPLVEQLREGGRMVIPVGKKWDQQLYLMVKKNGKLERQAMLPVLFVPMTGEIQGQQ